jgi:hypothetical protein
MGSGKPTVAGPDHGKAAIYNDCFITCMDPERLAHHPGQGVDTAEAGQEKRGNDHVNRREQGDHPQLL